MSLWWWFMSWTFHVQMSNWTFCHRPNTWILFALWFKITLQYDIVVILQVLHLQVLMLKWTSCHNPITRILLALWFKTAVQNYFVVILHVLPSQVQMSNESLVTIPTHESCSLFDSKLLFSMTLWWHFMSCHLKSICQMNLLLRSQHMNPVCSLIQSYSAIWICCDSSCPAIVQM